MDTVVSSVIFRCEPRRRSNFHVRGRERVTAEQRLVVKSQWRIVNAWGDVDSVILFLRQWWGPSNPRDSREKQFWTLLSLNPRKKIHWTMKLPPIIYFILPTKSSGTILFFLPYWLVQLTAQEACLEEEDWARLWTQSTILMWSSLLKQEYARFVQELGASVFN